jgi:hypothetical protein
MPPNAKTTTIDIALMVADLVKRSALSQRKMLHFLSAISASGLGGVGPDRSALAGGLKKLTGGTAVRHAIQPQMRSSAAAWIDSRWGCECENSCSRS